MKFWIVMTMLGNVAATWGPLPYGWDECQSRVKEKLVEIDQKFVDNPKAFEKIGVKREDVKMRCVARELRPELNQRMED